MGRSPRGRRAGPARHRRRRPQDAGAPRGAPRTHHPGGRRIMWPPYSDALNLSLDAEAALEELYVRALRRWASQARAVALPTLPEDELPPDPDAVTQTQSQWEIVLAAVVMPGVAALWDGAAKAAANGLRTVIGRVGGRFRTARDQFLRSYGQVGGKVPAMVADRLRTLIAAAPAGAGPSELRVLLHDALTPGSEMLDDLARNLGYDGA